MNMLDAIRAAATEGILARPIAWRNNGRGCYVQGSTLYIWDRAALGTPRLGAFARIDILDGEWEVVSQSQIADEVADGQ